MQNSGLGNAINPIISIAHQKVYSIPILLMIGWRGSPGIKDEPQHLVKGAITIKLLKLLNIKFCILNNQNDFSETFLSITSSISNIGLSLKGNYQNSSFIFLIITIIGGSFFSTSSGIRFVKIYSLFKFSVNELASHAKPLNIFVNKLEFSGSKLETVEINKYFISVLIFIISLCLLTSLLTIVGINLESAFKLAVLTLMNTVNSSIHGLNDFNFNELQYFTKYFLVIFMIIGRVELLTLLIILKKFLFKN